MPETGHHETYDSQGNVIEDIPFTVTDEQILVRDIRVTSNSYHTRAIQAYNNWGNLTLAQKDTILKEILGFCIAVGEDLTYFKV